MKENNNNIQTNHSETKHHLLLTALLTGFIGGCFWSMMAYVNYYFNLTRINPAIILEGWFSKGILESFMGVLVTMISYGLLSTIIAWIYYLFFRKQSSIWVGFILGISLFFLIFLIYPLINPSFKPLNELDINTIVSSICLYALFGVFVGYSISYETAQREEM